MAAGVPQLVPASEVLVGGVASQWGWEEVTRGLAGSVLSFHCAARPQTGRPPPSGPSARVAMFPYHGTGSIMQDVAGFNAPNARHTAVRKGTIKGLLSDMMRAAARPVAGSARSAGSDAVETSMHSVGADADLEDTAGRQFYYSAKLAEMDKAVLQSNTPLGASLRLSHFHAPKAVTYHEPTVMCARFVCAASPGLLGQT